MVNGAAVPAASMAEGVYPVGHVLTVSIIISSYNYECYLAEAIESALGQAHVPTEVIVVDDGSTDGSRAVVERFGGRVIAVYKPNGGQASAFNAGFARARGDVVIFLDADDVLLPETAGRVAAVFGANPALTKVMYRMEVIDADGRCTGVMKPAAHLPLLGGDLRRHVLTFPDDLTWMATSGNAFATRVLHGLFPISEQEFRNNPDWYLSLVSPLYGPVEFLSDVGARYRVHGHNSYEVEAEELDLQHVRQSIRYSECTRRYVERVADRLNLRTVTSRGTEILSVSGMANRLISLKLAPDEHPLRGDSAQHLAHMGIRVAWHRFDVPLPMRLMFGAWFLLMLAAPRPLARSLAEWFLIPEKRMLYNRLSRVVRRGGAGAS